MDYQSFVARMLSCLDNKETAQRLPTAMQSLIVYDVHSCAFVFRSAGAACFRRLYSHARQSNITIHACYVRFTAKSRPFISERRIALCWHIPLPLRLLLRARYQLDGVYIDFHRT